MRWLALSDTMLLATSAGSPLRAAWDVLPAAAAGGVGPCTRYGHAMVTFPDSPVVAMFGGNNGTNTLNDVWLFNARGNRYSKGHLWLDAQTEPEYWAFSFQDIASNDIPAALSFI